MDSYKRLQHDGDASTPVMLGNPYQTPLANASGLRAMLVKQQQALADYCLRKQLKHVDSPRASSRPLIINCIWSSYKTRFLALVRADVARKAWMVKQCEQLLTVLSQTKQHGLRGSAFDPYSKHPLQGSLTVYLAFYRDLPTVAPDAMQWLCARTLQLVEEDTPFFPHRDIKSYGIQFRKPCIYAIAKTLQAVHYFREGSPNLKNGDLRVVRNITDHPRLKVRRVRCVLCSAVCGVRCAVYVCPSLDVMRK